MLGHLKAGEKGKIKDISGADLLVQRRLLDFGITDGCEISIKCIMPFGGPFMVECHGQCVGIRRKEACRIRVEREI